jgi:hypothetical protein
VRLRSLRGAKRWFVGSVTGDWMWLDEIWSKGSV